MPQFTIAKELQLIENILILHPDGLSIAAIDDALQLRHQIKLNRRTLQRQIKEEF